MIKSINSFNMGLRTIIIFALLMTFIGLSYQDVAADLLVNPADDAYIYNAEPTIPHDGIGLYLGYSPQGGLVSTHETYIKYDLSDVNSETGRSTFNFTITNNFWEQPYNVTVSLYSVSDDTWSETTLTWNNSPAIVNPGSISLLETKVIAPGTNGLITYGSTTEDNPVGTFIENERTGDGVASFLLRITAVAPGGFFGLFAVAEDRENTQTPGVVDEPYLDMRSPTALTLTEFTVSNSPSSRVALWLGIGISLLMLGGVFLLRKRSKI